MVLEATRSNLHRARSAKNDEFYTGREDIENELGAYEQHFAGKSVLLNCDDPEWSEFWFYFYKKFRHLGLRHLAATHYNRGGSGYRLEQAHPPESPDHKNVPKEKLEGDGDFRSPEAIELLEKADIVVTNPPFSLFREYISQLIASGKKFVIIGNRNAVTYKDIWPLIETGKMWLGGYPGTIRFRVPEDYPMSKWGRSQDSSGVHYQAMRNVTWFTNLDIPRRHEDIFLFRSYSADPSKYPRYENFDAIEVSRVSDIPRDYEGNMGVPITFLAKHNPEQFEIVGQSRMLAAPVVVEGKRVKDFVYRREDGSIFCPYMRVVVRRKR